MRFANPPGLASFMAKNAGYDEIGGRAIKDAVDQDLTTMGTMGEAQANALNTIARNEAAEYARDAEAFGMAQQADAQLFGSIAGAVGTIGGSAIKGGAFASKSGPVTKAYKGLGGFGPVADGEAYGTFLDSTAGTTGIGPFANSDVYGSFLSRR
jgi:hypothetical protein